jgi:tungstate transport system permease protein
MLVSCDPEVYRIVWVSLQVSLISTAIATAFALPVGMLIALNAFRGRRVVIIVMNTLMSMPTVLIGLVVFAFISRSGVLGPLGLELLYTKTGMIIGLVLLVGPLMTALIVPAVESLDPRILPTAYTLGASKIKALWTLLSEGRYAIITAIASGFGRAIAEVGIAMMLGGNIREQTRTITTAIALETGKGEFALGVALGLVLLFFAFGINLALALMRRRHTRA